MERRDADAAELRTACAFALATLTGMDGDTELSVKDALSVCEAVERLRAVLKKTENIR